MNKLVRESISFERGRDPRKSLKVGKLERLKEKYGKKDLDELLVEACEVGNLADVKFLVKNGANVHFIEEFPLRFAAEYGHLDVVKYLVEQGAVIKTIYDPALKYSVLRGHLDVVKYLIEHGSEGMIISKELISKGLLNLANKRGHKDIAEYLKSIIDNGKNS